MRTFTVTAQRGHGPVWVLECAEVGAVSQTKRLDHAANEMHEVIAYQADDFYKQAEEITEIAFSTRRKALKTMRE